MYPNNENSPLQMKYDFHVYSNCHNANRPKYIGVPTMNSSKNRTTNSITHIHSPMFSESS